MSQVASNDEDDTTDDGGINLEPGQLRDLVLQIAFWEDWVMRRVETVTILDETRIKRHVSMDFLFRSYDAEAEPANGLDEQPHLVPITLLNKSPLRNFNIFDDRATVLPVLTTEQNLSVSCQVLARLSELDGNGGVDIKLIRELILGADLPTFDKSLNDLLSVPDGEDPRVWVPTFRRLAREFRESFLLIAWMRLRPGERRIVKYEYEGTMVVQAASRTVTALSQARAAVRWLRGRRLFVGLMQWVRRQWIRHLLAAVAINIQRGLELVRELAGDLRLWLAFDPIRIDVTAEAVARARSYHIEVPAPDGLSFVNARFIVGIPDQAPDSTSTDNAGIDRVHLHIAEQWIGGVLKLRRGMTGLVTLDLRPSPGQLLRHAFLVAWLIASALGVGLIAHDALGVHPRLDATSALIVALPAIFAIFLVAPGEHRLAQRLVSGVRDRIWLSAALAFAAAAILTLDLGPGWRPTVWLALFAAASANCFAYFWSIRQGSRAISRRLS